MPEISTSPFESRNRHYLVPYVLSLDRTRRQHRAYDDGHTLRVRPLFGLRERETYGPPVFLAQRD